MVNNLRIPFWPTFLVACALRAVGCRETPAQPDDAGVDAVVTADARSDASADGSTDAFVDPGTQYDFCDEPFFKLPIDGVTELAPSVTIRGSLIAYSKTALANTDFDVPYLLSLSDCMGYQLADRVRAAGPTFAQNMVVWNDYLPDPTNPQHCTDFYGFDLVTWRVNRLTDDSSCKSGMQGYGNHLVFLRKNSTADNVLPDLFLWDLEQDRTWRIASGSSRAAYIEIGDRFVVYSALSYLPGSTGRDIGVWDLEQEEGFWIPQSTGVHTYGTFTSGNLITYATSVTYDIEPYSLMLYHRDDNDASPIIEDEYLTPFGHIDGNLVASNTSLHTGLNYAPPMDIELYDVASGSRRRLTRQSAKLWVAGISFPYLLLGDRLDLEWPTQYDYYVAHLVKLGVTDAQGNLLPGDPVIDPP